MSGGLRRALLISFCALMGAAAHAAGTLPDWSGWWGLSTPVSEELSNAPPPMRPADAARLRQMRAEDLDPDPLRYCRPPQFVGYSGGFVDSVEFLFTPGRVTLTNEAGLIRRIYTDGRALPRDVDATNSGTSIGHWEGQTLVVETIGINPLASYPSTSQGDIAIGKNVKVSERISLTGPNTLQFDVTLVAPDIFTAPDQRKRVYSRQRKTAPSEITFCTEFDRSIDPASGKQRFDMTPPADLAPPPPRRP